jgi:hypothetical protein
MVWQFSVNIKPAWIFCHTLYSLLMELIFSEIKTTVKGSNCKPWKFTHMELKTFTILYLIDYLLFYVPLKNLSLIWRRHHYRRRAAKFRPMLSAQGLWAGRDLYRATPAVTRGLGFFGLIRRTAPFSRLLRHTRGVWRTYSIWLYTPSDLWDYVLQKIRIHCLNRLHPSK